MLVNICMKFHEGILKGFWVTERTRPNRKIYYFQFQRAITPKIRNPELWFLRSACRLLLLYICVKFHENISNGFWWMDGWVRVLRPFNSISVISRRWEGEHERLCAMKRRLGSGRISPPAGFEPATPWSEVGSANRSATRSLQTVFELQSGHNFVTDRWTDRRPGQKQYVSQSFGGET